MTKLATRAEKYGWVKRPAKTSTLPRKLNQSDLRMLINSNCVLIDYYNQGLAYAKVRESDLWHLSDKDDSSTTEYFVELNKQKDYVRFLQKRLAQMKDIQRKLKLQMSDF